MSRDETVRILLAEMRYRLEHATPQTRERDNAAITAMSDVIAAMTMQFSLPLPVELEHLRA